MPSEIRGSDNFNSDSAGKVLQVVEARDTSSITASVGTEATVVTLDITPSSVSSKILISYSVDLEVFDNRGTAYTDGGSAFVVRDGSTEVCTSLIEAQGSDHNRGRGIAGGTYLDTPNTASQITYSVKITGSESAYDYAIAKGDDTPSVLVLQEIAG